jgi:hypothetical protein
VVDAKFKKDDAFRLMMAGFYRVSKRDKIEYVRVYSIYNPAYHS